MPIFLYIMSIDDWYCNLLLHKRKNFYTMKSLLVYAISTPEAHTHLSLEENEIAAIAIY